ncbi:MAG: hypothetical protein JWQ14_3052 [Adhaeribacter sp.]|nr:hypothetical protein [Adhaeribacter sp.]
MFASLLPGKFTYLVLIGIGMGLSSACSKPRKAPPTKPEPVVPQAVVPVHVPDLDTLRVEDDFANAPFLLDSISLTEVQKLMGRDVRISKKPTRNHFVANQTDTLITLRKQNSHIILYAVSAEPKCFFKEAAIKDPFPIFQYQLQIGQHKTEVKKLFSSLKNKPYLPDNIEIVAGEGVDYIYLNFKNDVLQQIEYKPYLD